MLQAMKRWLVGLLNFANGVTDAPMELAALQVGLFLDLLPDNNPDPDRDLDHVVEASFPGYSRQTVSSVGAPFLDSNGDVTIQMGPNTFTCSASTTPQTIKGHFLVTDEGSVSRLIGTELWAQSRAFQDTLSQATVLPRLSLNPLNSYGDGVVSD